MQDYLMIIEQINKRFEQFKLMVLQETENIDGMEKFNLTPQQEMIMAYIIQNEPVIANDIAKYLDISKSAVSQVITKIENNKMISRQANPANRRESLIFLGENGEEYHQLLIKMDQLLVEKYYSKVSVEELENVYSILTKIVKKSNY